MGIKILGISGSLRKKSGTSEAVKKALEGAVSIDADVSTEFVALRGKKITACTHCDVCARKRSLCVIKDDFQEVQEKFLEADGYIIGSPVYEMNYTPLLGSFLSRIRDVYLVYPGHFTRRAGAAISVGGHRHGGQEMVQINIQNFFNTNEIVSSGGTLYEYAGAGLWSGDGTYEGTMKDDYGMDSAYRVGQRLAQTTALLKFGEEMYEKEGHKIIRTQGWYDSEG